MDLFDLAVANKLAGGGGGGGDIDVDSLTVTENGTYSASSGHAYSPVTVSVPQGVFPSGTSSITANGIYDITSFASVDVNVSGGGGGVSVDDFAQKTLSGAISGEASKIEKMAFIEFKSITEANFPNVETIGVCAFTSCTNLSKVSFPSAKSLYSSCFGSCASLTEASFPKVEAIHSSAFYNCINLAKADFPKAQTVYGSAFQLCSKLATTNFPALKTAAGQAFAGCKSLSSIVFPVLSSLGGSCFIGCTSLMALTLLSTSVAALANVSVFNNTPMSNSGLTGAWGSIYVPDSLVSNYKAANNWSAYADRITSYVE